MIGRGQEEEQEARSDRYKIASPSLFSIQVQPLMKVVGESSGSEPLVKKSKSSISSSMNKSDKSNEASKTLVKITIEHCNS